MINGLIKLSFFILLSLSHIEIASAIEASEFGNKIAFLRNGDVWITDQSGREIKQITKTDGKVGKFLFSPTLRYLAYSKIIKYVDDPGLYEEGEAPKVPVYSIVIMDIKKQKIMKEIKPPISEGDDWIYMDKWLPDEKLIFHSADGFSVGWFFEYDAIKNMYRKDETEELNQLSGGYISRDGTLMVSSVSTIGLTDLRSKKVTILNPTNTVRRKFDAKISNSKEYIAWIEYDHKENGKAYYALWIYNLKTGLTRNLYKNFTAVRNLSWSFDDKLVCVYDERYQQEIFVVDIQNLSITHKLEAKDPIWISNNNIIFAQADKDIYIYDLTIRKKELFVENASMPRFLWHNSK